MRVCHMLDPSNLSPSKCCPGADGIQHSGHALLAGSFPAGSLVRLHSKYESKGKVQLGCPHSFPPTGDQASRLEQKGMFLSLIPRVVQWVEKASFTRLNKLFEIDALEQNHKVLLSNKNLLALINEPKSFVIPVFSRVAPLSLVLGKHFVVKDLPFYAGRPLVVRRARTPPPAPSSFPLTSSSSLSLSSSTPNSEPEARAEWVRLSESIAVSPSFSKKAYLKHAYLEPTSAPVLVPVSLTIVVEIIPKPKEKLSSTDDIAHHEPRRPFTGRNHFSEESLNCMASSPSHPKPSYVPNWEEVAELLRQRYLPHHAYAGLHGFRECGSGDSQSPKPYATVHSAILLVGSCQDHEGVDLLKRVEEEKEATQAKAHRLVEKNETMEVGKKKAEGETGRLSQELEELWTRFAIQKEELEAEYQKQVDNMFFYGYHYCMKKHGIAQDTPRVSSDEEKEVVSGPARGEGDASGADPFSGRA
ncbi:hypothetical protein CK203_103668 [Vitis vinifera]|uniref:Uncharacterized protein n=1 Tax=Vitis vinifera TaxID=29760 RepID=A0A438DNE4_VITVI|nr:hypothetical protein CK203_103668 [Vitis vinifera]